MVVDKEIWTRLRTVEESVTVLQTKMQGIWWVMNIVGTGFLVYIVDRILKD